MFKIKLFLIYQAKKPQAPSSVSQVGRAELRDRSELLLHIIPDVKAGWPDWFF